LKEMNQLNNIAKVLFKMSSDNPVTSAAIWNRRICLEQKKFATRMKFPSIGVFMAMKLAKDMNLYLMTASLFIGQVVSQGTIESSGELVLGLLYAGLFLEMNQTYEQITPEAMTFIAGVLRKFVDIKRVQKSLTANPNPSLNNYNWKGSSLLRKYYKLASGSSSNDGSFTEPKLEVDNLEECDPESPELAAAVFCTVLKIVQRLGKLFKESYAEALFEVRQSLEFLSSSKLPAPFAQLVEDAMKTVRCVSRSPLQRLSKGSSGIKSFAPRMDDQVTLKTLLTQKKQGTTKQQQHRSLQQQIKREQKAAEREIRLDAGFIKAERRNAKEKRDNKARSARQKNFAWLEAEQATLNQQVRQGGGLLSGGGIGAAKRKLKTGMMGIKKGGKFRG